MYRPLTHELLGMSRLSSKPPGLFSPFASFGCRAFVTPIPECVHDVCTQSPDAAASVQGDCTMSTVHGVTFIMSCSLYHVMFSVQCLK